MNRIELMQHIAAHCSEHHKNPSAMARHLGISRSAVSQMMRGVIPPSAQLLADMGLVRIITETYEPAPEDEH